MPELPEVETVARGLERLQGQELRVFTLFDRKVWFECKGKPANFVGLRLESVYRHGKYIVFEFSHPKTQQKQYLVAHLRMTGKLLNREAAAIPEKLKQAWGVTKQIRFAMEFTSETLCFWDTRRFGTITAVKNLDEFWLKKKYAPDPLNQTELARIHFHKNLAKSQRAVKVALLDQSIAAGTGNIYADEALHRTGIHPQKIAARLSPEKREAIFNTLLEIFRASIKSGGTTANNYLNAAGIPGKYSDQLKVYDRKGESCLTCNAARIKRIVLGGRSTHFCPKCQSK